MKKISVILVAVLFLFGAISAVNAQGLTLPGTVQESINRFPADLRSGFQGAYIANSMAGASNDLLGLFNLFHMVNLIRTELILTGRGNEMAGDTGQTVNQQYSYMRGRAIQSMAMLQMMTMMAGNPGGTNWDVWASRVMAWL